MAADGGSRADGESTVRNAPSATVPAEEVAPVAIDDGLPVPLAERRHPRTVSPIALRILAINVVALGLLLAGLLYLGNYRDGLVESEMDALQTQAELFAVAIAEAATQGDDTAEQKLARDIGRQMLQRLVENTGTRAQLFHSSGALFADSRALGRSRGWVREIALPPPEEDGGMVEDLLDLYDRTTWWLMTGHVMPRYEEPTSPTAQSYPEAVVALSGETARVLRAAGRTDLVMSVAVPVQRYKQVLGALLLSKPGDGIREAVLDVRVDILRVFAVVMTVTILISLYLARSIATPLRRLSAAADRVRHDHGRQEQIPDFAHRTDEIGDLSVALREMTQGLWQRMDAIERFAADVAHEIKNPLTSLRSAVETAARIEDPERRAKLMAIILDDVGRLDRLITDISDASRLDAELSRSVRHPIDIGAMLSTLVDVYQATEGRGPHVALELVPGSVGLEDGASGTAMAVSGMEDRLVQVFRNLITNAISFSPPGGQTRITVKRDGNWVEITCDDDGPGIPDGKEASIFERFYTERPAGEKFGTHSGLGLAISKQIVDAHDGTIKAVNRTDVSGTRTGARFVVHLPALTPEVKQSKSKRSK